MIVVPSAINTEARLDCRMAAMVTPCGLKELWINVCYTSMHGMCVCNVACVCAVYAHVYTYTPVCAEAKGVIRCLPSFLISALTQRLSLNLELGLEPVSPSAPLVSDFTVLGT